MEHFLIIILMWEVFGKQTKSHQKITTNNKNTPQENRKTRQGNSCPISAIRRGLSCWSHLHIHVSPGVEQINYQNKMTGHGSSNYWLTIIIRYSMQTTYRNFPTQGRIFQSDCVSAPKHTVRISKLKEKGQAAFPSNSAWCLLQLETPIFPKPITEATALKPVSTIVF